METLFVYGTLHDPKVQMMLIGRELASVPDVLMGYFRNTDLFPPYPVALPIADSSINGWRLEVTAAELTKLDIYEGENYIRVQVTLASGTSAWVYCASPLLLGASNTDADATG